MPSAITVTERTYTPGTLIHRHPYAQVVLPDRGRLDLVIAGQRGAVAGTGYAVVTPETEHICWADRPTRCLVVDLPRPLLAEACTTGPGGWERSSFRPFDDRARSLAHLLRIESRAGGLNEPLVAEALGRYAANAFAAPEQRQPSSQPVTGGQGSRLLARRVRAHLDAFFCEDLSLTAIAESVGASVAHVQRSFRTETGSTVVAYVHDRRLDAVAGLLRTTDLSVTEIAHKTGFGSASYLARLFARRFGTSPSRYRIAR
jgi:AraC family transcriptional regulator